MLKKVLDPVVECVLAAIMAVMCSTVFIGVVYRYVLVSPLAWTEEIARLSLVWMTFLGSYIAMQRDNHMYITILYDSLPDKWKGRFDLAGNSVLIIFYVVLIKYGKEYTSAFMKSYSPYLEIPLSVSYIALPIGAGLLLIGTISRLWHFVFALNAKAGSHL